MPWRHGILFALAVLAPSVTQQPREQLEGWGASVAPPPGWRVLRNSGRAAAFSDSLQSGAVFVTAGFLAAAADGDAELRALFADLHYDAQLAGSARDTTISGRRARLLRFSGAGRAGPVDARAAVVFTTYGTGITILALGVPAGSAALGHAVVRFAASLEAAAPVVNRPWLTGLSGRWNYVAPPAAARDSTATGTTAIDEWLEFDGRERFSWRARTVVTLNAAGVQPLVAESAEDSGTYTVIGSTLVLRGTSQRRALDVRLRGDTLGIGGKVYARKAT